LGIPGPLDAVQEADARPRYRLLVALFLCHTEERHPLSGGEAQHTSLRVLRVTDSGSAGEVGNLHAIVVNSAVAALTPHLLLGHSLTLQ